MTNGETLMILHEFHIFTNLSKYHNFQGKISAWSSFYYYTFTEDT